MSNTIHELRELGQSVWCDNISRGMIDSGELQRLIDLGVAGVTSNPTIFAKAITSGTDYDRLFDRLLGETPDDMGLYEGLVIPDIADAADILRPVYDRTEGVDGYVSIEVNPKLAYDTEGTVQEARRLWGMLGRPNVLIKVPATEEGMPAVETLIGEGINVNVTLIFSIGMYEKVMQAYMAGLEKLLASGGDVGKVSSVASFFVSRVDTAVDKLLEVSRAQGAEVGHLLGESAVANAKLAYARFGEVFASGGRWGELVSRGARLQRPLWASTSTKNSDYPDTLYVDNLVGPHTVNTLPPVTIEAVLDHGGATATLAADVDSARSLFGELAELDINIEAVTDQLLIEGVKAFEGSFDDVLADITAKKSKPATMS